MEFGYDLFLLISAALCFVFLLHYSICGRSETLPTNWPVVGMLPSLLVNLHRYLDWCTHFLSNNGCTFVFRGPWFSNMSTMLYTSDPANMRHIFNTNFSGYPKGSQFKEIFDILGDELFNADGETWKTQRKEIHQVSAGERFQRFHQQLSCKKVVNGLLPVLEHALNRNMVVDLQDLFKRFTFDATIMLISGIDPGSLGFEFERNPYLKAFEDAEEAIMYRHVMPVSLWKLQRWLGFGREKKLAEAKMLLDQFAAHCISAKREIMKKGEQGADLLTPFLEGEEKSDTFLRDLMVNIMLAGTGTVAVGLTWFFWIVLQNPRVEIKILEELMSKISTSDDKKLKTFDVDELKGLVYLHAAFCDALRLFPPVPLELRRPLKQDILPSGHRVNPGTDIFLSIYGMARMETVWGKDCLEFKPERWISEEGGIKHVPSHKFMSFLTGPRSCIGKEISFAQMKMVAATILYNFHVELDDSHIATSKNSIILYMNRGLMARIKRRSEY